MWIKGFRVGYTSVGSLVVVCVYQRWSQDVCAFRFVIIIMFTMTRSSGIINSSSSWAHTESVLIPKVFMSACVLSTTIYYMQHKRQILLVACGRNVYMIVLR